MQMLNREQRRAIRALEHKDASAAQVAEIMRQVKSITDDLMTGFEEFKKTNDQRLKELKAGGVDILTKGKLDNIEKTLSGFEEVNQKLQTALDAQKKADERAKEMSETIDALELKLKRPLAGSEGDKAERKKFYKNWIHGVVGAQTIGVANLPEEQRKAIEKVAADYKSLSITNDVTGGYLAPAEFVAEIIKEVTLISPVRSLVKVVTTANKSRIQPKRTGRLAAQWVTEQGTRTETTGLQWGSLEIPTHEMFAMIDVSHQNLEDSAFDLAAETSEEASEQFQVAEGAAVVAGNAVGKPEGWMTNAGVAYTPSGTGNTIADANGTADGLIKLKYSIKSAYAARAKWVMNRTTMGSVRTLKDAQNRYIWMPGIQAGAPNTIDGDPYVEVPDMPSIGANTYPIAYGDFMSAYTMVDRIAMNMLRDPYTQATAGNIRFLFYRRLGGQVVLAEAIGKLKCATS
ncbi:phage major capsid protein [Nitrobacter sp.]|uniref:phage major capsid protein n=1 Tax=Nitrobacter sp. TaxID=29420 RepID=UPI0029CAAC58|nr:phage major capsid protein [Nitrobacter sp.]